MPQRVKPVTRWGGGSLSASMTGVGVVGVTAQEVTGAGAHAVSVGVASSGSGSAVIPGSEPYDLGVVPFAYSWPADPTITPGDEVTVTSANITANSNLTTSGRRLILTADAGSYAGFTVSGNDREIVFQSGVTVTGTINIGGSRITFRGSPERDHTINNFNMSPFDALASTRTDLKFIGLNVVSGEGPQGNHQNAIRGHRVLFLRSYFDSVGFGIWMAFNNDCRDVIVARTYIYQHRPASDQGGTTQAALRIKNFQRFISVDSRYRNENDDPGLSSRQHLRLHSSNVGAGDFHSEYVYVRNNQFIGTGTQYRPNDAVGTNTPFPMPWGWWYDNDFYPYLYGGATPNIIGSNSVDDPQTTDVIWSGNRLFTDTGQSFSIGAVRWTATNNTVLPLVEPPAWTWE